jgi:hypothetical protein
MMKIGVLRFVMSHRSHVGVMPRERIVIVTDDVMLVQRRQERTEIGVVGVAVVLELTIVDVSMTDRLGEVDRAGVTGSATRSATRNVVALQVAAEMTGEGMTEIDLGRIVIDRGEILMTGGHQCVILIVHGEIVTLTAVTENMTGLVTVILTVRHVIVTSTGGIVILIDLVTEIWIVAARETLIVPGHVIVHREILTVLVMHSRGHNAILSGHRGTHMMIKAEIVAVALAEIERRGQLPEMIGVAEKKSHEMRRNLRNHLVTKKKVAAIVKLTKTVGRPSNINPDDMNVTH